MCTSIVSLLYYWLPLSPLEYRDRVSFIFTCSEDRLFPLHVILQLSLIILPLLMLQNTNGLLQVPVP
jgi:hypothetical protein